MVVEAVYVEVGMMCQVHIGHKGTSAGDFCIYPLDGSRVEISPGQDGGDGDLCGGEGLGGGLCHSPYALCYSFLLSS